MANKSSPPPEVEAVAPDPFDPANLRLDPALYSEGIAVKKLVTTVPVRKPGKQEFVRVHPNNLLSPAALIEVKDDRECFLVVPSLAPELTSEYSFVALYQGQTRQQVNFLWPVKLPGSDGRINHWHSSMAEAVERAKTRWIRIAANMSLGAYEMAEAQGNLSDPEWPDLSISELLRIAFKGRLVDTIDHPILRKLRGEI
jgi:hypothetical protein